MTDSSAGKIIVETERLVIRQWEPDDWMRFRPLVTDPRVLEYLCSEPWSDDRTQEFISKQIEFSNSRGWAGWPVVHRKDNVLIGFFGFGDEIPPDVQIGWRFLPEYWGRGLATEAATAMMQYGFDTFHFDRLIAVAHPVNLRSISIMKKLGMTFEKPLSYKGIEVVCYARANPTTPGWPADVKRSADR